MVLCWSLVTHEGLYKLSGTVAAKWSMSGARPVLEGLGWSPVTHEGLYIIIQAVSMLLNGTLVEAWGPWVLEWSPSPHEGLDTLYKETCSPDADCCSIAPLRLQRGCSMVFEWC